MVKLRVAGEAVLVNAEKQVCAASYSSICMRVAVLEDSEREQ